MNDNQFSGVVDSSISSLTSLERLCVATVAAVLSADRSLVWQARAKQLAVWDHSDPSHQFTGVSVTVRIHTSLSEHGAH